MPSLASLCGLTPTLTNKVICQSLSPHMGEYRVCWGPRKAFLEAPPTGVHDHHVWNNLTHQLCPVLAVVAEFSNFKKRGFLSLIPKCVILWWVGNETQKKSTVLSLHRVKNLDFLQIAPSEPELLKPKGISRQLWHCHAINNPFHKASYYPHLKRWSWGSSGAQYSTSV